MSILTERTNPYVGNLSHTINFFDSDGGVIDITRLVLEFNIYENIFSHTIAADFAIRDAIGLIDAGQSPMTGQEFIEISFQSNNSSLLGAAGRPLMFKVNRVANKKEITAGSAVYTLDCSSIEYERNMTTDVITSSKDKLGSEVVKDIFNNYIYAGNKKGLEVEESENVVPYTAVGQTPFEAIETIAKECRSKGTYGDASHYLFYETTQGFDFRTLTSLLQQDPRPGVEYYFSNAAAADSYPPEKTIIGHTFLDNVDTIDLLLKGMYGGDVGVIDPITKKFSETSFNYAKDFDRLPHITGGGYPTINLSRSNVLESEAGSSSHKRFLVGDLASQSGNNISFDSRITPDNDPYTFHGREQYRKAPLVAAQLASLQQFGINISVAANLNVNAGDIIQLFIPGNKDRQGVADSAFINHYGSSPTFLVIGTAIKHTLNGDYISTFQCVKESFATDLRGQRIQIEGESTQQFTAGPLAYLAQTFSKNGTPTDNHTSVVSGVVDDIKTKALDKGLKEVSKAAEKAASDDTDKATSDDTDTDTAPETEVTTGDAIKADLDQAAADIETEARALAADAVKDFANAALATGAALVTAKVMSSLNVSPAKLAKIIAVIKLLEKIPIFKGPIADVKGDIAGLKEGVTSTVDSATDSITSSITGGGD